MICSEGDECLCVVAMFAHSFTKVLVEECRVFGATKLSRRPMFRLVL
jgi:hypothetical protein